MERFNFKRKKKIEKEEKLTDEKHNEGHIPMMIAAMNGHSKTILILIQTWSIRSGQSIIRCWCRPSQS
jgi:hypothetical protein